MKLKDILTSDELKELKAVKPVNNVIHAPEHIAVKIRKAMRGKNIKLKGVKV